MRIKAIVHIRNEKVLVIIPKGVIEKYGCDGITGFNIFGCVIKNRTIIDGRIKYRVNEKGVIVIPSHVKESLRLFDKQGIPLIICDH